ncbi:uncharacterized protein LOC131155585 [Malania oleifera]|uniref:uncharacterized protein LOC131155585 n=1 Tax=Malania oleifera TaxID=397392 RepID=UPI0025AE3C4A|nr:uncharacterized protein LOC131155585 [Malania oleifera]
MAVQSKSSSSWLLSLKVLLVSMAVLFVAVALKVSVPVISEFAVNEVPLIWRLVLSWFRPPYLYLVINCIIITIVASSKFQSNTDSQQEAPAVEAIKGPGGMRTDYSVAYGSVVGNAVETVEYKMAVPEAEYSRVGEDTPVSETKTTVNDASEVSSGADLASLRSSGTPQKKDSAAEDSFSTEKPLVSARFGHRKSVKASPEGGKALRVSKPKRQDTLESTWKTITDGRPMPLARHLKKSDTWETHGRHGSGNAAETPDQMKKSETFNDRSTANSALTRSPGSGKLRREPSLSQDELNRRVEAFIKKFNEEMRLQRQESLNQYHGMISRGAH